MFRLVVGKRFLSSVLDKNRECFVEVESKLFSQCLAQILTSCNSVDHLAYIKFNRPNRKNALGYQMVKELNEVIDYLVKAEQYQFSRLAIGALLLRLGSLGL